ncbi:hypothetical protein OUZ56_001363 [Daphnia magna]|uniref:Uncharacterized protein n=1 Tax=Daphnia magna TaxID=35525 RepID=A0ABR0A2E5_9CRUS|nr:hypothetical protein OUZ56_001363 [Daphnia magna]
MVFGALAANNGLEETTRRESGRKSGVKKPSVLLDRIAPSQRLGLTDFVNPAAAGRIQVYNIRYCETSQFSVSNKIYADSLVLNMVAIGLLDAREKR